MVLYKEQNENTCPLPYNLVVCKLIEPVNNENTVVTLISQWGTMIIWLLH